MSSRAVSCFLVPLLSCLPYSMPLMEQWFRTWKYKRYALGLRKSRMVLSLIRCFFSNKAISLNLLLLCPVLGASGTLHVPMLRCFRSKRTGCVDNRERKGTVVLRSSPLLLPKRLVRRQIWVVAALHLDSTGKCPQLCYCWSHLWFYRGHHYGSSDFTELSDDDWPILMSHSRILYQARN